MRQPPSHSGCFPPQGHTSLVPVTLRAGRGAPLGGVLAAGALWWFSRSQMLFLGQAREGGEGPGMRAAGGMQAGVLRAAGHVIYSALASGSRSAASLTGNVFLLLSAASKPREWVKARTGPHTMFPLAPPTGKGGGVTRSFNMPSNDPSAPSSCTVEHAHPARGHATGPFAPE